MAPVTHPFVTLGFLSTLAAVGIAAIAWHQRESTGAREYTAVMVVLAVWSMLYVMQLLQPTVPEKTPWLVARHALTPCLGILFWVFAARYTDRPALLSTQYLAPIVTLGVAISVVVIANPGGIYWVEFSPAVTSSVPVVDITFGPGFWLNAGFTLGVVAAGHVYIVRMFQDSLDVYRPQLTAMTITGVIEFGLTAMFLSDHVSLLPPLNPWPHIQLITYGTTLAVIPIGWSYINGALFKLQPLAGQTVIENMDDPVFVFDRNDMLQYTNSAGRRLLSDRELPPGRHHVENVFDEQPTVRAQYRQAWSNGKSDSETIRFDLDGETHRYDMQGSVISNSIGQPVGAVVSGREVTELHRQRAELHDRTEELKDKKAQLEQQNKQLDRFNSFISHDLRSPIQVASGHIHLAKQTEDLSHLSGAEASIRRMGEMVEDLRKLTRIDQTDLSTEPVEIDAASNQAWRQVDTPTEALEIDASRAVIANRELLLHVLENLFRNSVEHGSTGSRAEPGDAVEYGTSSGGSQADDAVDDPPAGDADSDHATEAVTVRVVQLDDGFAVEDDGKGIPESERDSVLEHGYSTASDGTGLGLSIVRTIADAHSWEIDVTESSQGGARFELRGVEMVDATA